jgi:hypothetical protein
MKKLVLVGGSLLAVVLIVLGSQTNVVGYQTVKSSQENDCINMTIQPCGIRGLRNTSVRLTRQQFENLNMFLETFSTRLNQTKTRDEALPLFKNAVVELHNYGLLPKGMNIQQVQNLVIGEDLRFPHYKIGRHSITHPEIVNLACLVFVKGENAFNLGLLSNIAYRMFYIFPRIGIFLVHLTQLNPFLPCNIVCLYPDKLISIGLYGIVQQNESRLLDMIFFAGLKIVTEPKFNGFEVEQAVYIGCSAVVSYRLVP